MKYKKNSMKYQKNTEFFLEKYYSKKIQRILKYVRKIAKSFEVQ